MTDAINGGTPRQQDDYKFFTEHLPEFLKDKRLIGKYLVIADKAEQGFYDTFETALQSALTKYSMGDFIIQEVVDESQIVNFVFPAL